MGACDVVTCPGQDRELAFRLTLQMVRKKRVDTLRGQLEHGLQAAVLDPLTGLHNRRYAQVFLRRLIDQSQATETSFAVMIADLDHFKSVNDTHGHATGDRVLVRTAAAMRDTLPNGAMIARIGGEEFLIAVPDVTLAKVRQLAGRLGRAVRQAPIAIKDTNRSIHVTVSIGATLVNPAQTHRNISTEALIEQADRALYDSKSGGRDTVTVSLRPAA
jgi:two-component system cell cycle response regulator